MTTFARMVEAITGSYCRFLSCPVISSLLRNKQHFPQVFAGDLLPKMSAHLGTHVPVRLRDYLI